MKTADMIRSFLVLACAVLFFAGCEETPVEPIVGSGDVLKATINGQAYTFDINSGVSAYDTTLLFGEFAGSTNTPPIQSIKISFTHDLDKGTFPATLRSPDALITIVSDDEAGGTPNSYQLVSAAAGSVVLKASNGEIVDGTFSGTLENTKDATDKITVTNGEFSVKLTRN